eukprot:Tamp_24303.p1 GENE.Tamp_24303~~Tamp_24303.p1  ORF type:complete len:152 (-),score=1.63 Tamp_24303:244-699(-)
MDNASCIMMSENPSNRDRTRHVDTRVHYLRELVRDGHVKLLKCAGPQNVADALTKSLPRPALAKHRQFMWGTRIPFSAFHLQYLSRHKRPQRPPMISSREVDVVLQALHQCQLLSMCVCRVCCLCVCVIVPLHWHDVTNATGGERKRVWGN